MSSDEYIEASLNEIENIHGRYKSYKYRIYPNEEDIAKLIGLYLSIIYDFQDREHSLCIVKAFKRILGEVILKCTEESVLNKDEAIKYIIENLPILCIKSQQDIDLAFNEDPAAFLREEIINCYPFAKAVPTFRLANLLNQLKVPVLPRLLTEYMHYRTGIDIHPSADIDSPFFIDHGTGVVIGGTATIGKNVKIFHGVTLGAKSFEKDLDGVVVKGKKRHPTIKDNVSIYSGAVILGGDTIIENNAVIGGNAWITHGIPKNTMVYINDESLMYVRVLFSSEE